MKRVAVLLVALLAMMIAAPSAYARTSAPTRVAAVTITSASVTCGAGGYTTVTVDLKAAVAGTYDVTLRTDSVYQSPGWVDEVTLAAGESYEGLYSESYPQQTDVLVTNAYTGATVASRSAPAPIACTHGW